MRRRSSWLALVAALALASCRHVTAPVQPVGDWGILVGPVEPFAAVYRLACCGRRGMVAAVRGDASSLLVAVSAPPVGEIVQAWATTGGVEVFWPRDGCRRLMPEGLLPLDTGAVLAVEPTVLALVLSGRLPDDSRAVAGLGGWVAGSVGHVPIRARLDGDPARVVQIVVAGQGDRPDVAIECSDHRSRVPGSIAVASGGEHAELRLASWRASNSPAAPAWLDQPVCAGGT